MQPPKRPQVKTSRDAARGGPGRPRRESLDRNSDRPSGRPPASGFGTRQAAVATLALVLDRGRALDDALAFAFEAPLARDLEPRDRALVRLIVLTALRRKGELDAVIATFLDKPLPTKCGRLRAILLSAAAQLLVLETPPHAAISLAVDQTRADHEARRFDKLANAVLRRVAVDGPAILASLDGARINVPAWLFARWQRAYGEATARIIAVASLNAAPLDVSVKADAATWAPLLGGSLLRTGSIRVQAAGRIEDLPHFDDGAWWVQDAAAALPVRLFGNVAGWDVADLCAAPGGKTAQLAAAGAHVTAVDLSAERLGRLKQNLARLHLSATTVVADGESWKPGRRLDGVLLDAPCTATGTIRRHPDIMHLKRDSDLKDLTNLQARLLAAAGQMIKPGGLLVYCTCSLEPEEGIDQVGRFLAEHVEFERAALEPGEAGIDPAWITADGDLRTLPFHLGGAQTPHAGMDGFFAARLRRNSKSP